MNKKVFSGLTIVGASILSSCGDGGRGQSIELCSPIVETEVAINMEEVLRLSDSSVGYLKDPEANTGLSHDREKDKIDSQGEIACLNENGELVLTIAGLALQTIINSEQ